jgi:hypothetical protein
MSKLLPMSLSTLVFVLAAAGCVFRQTDPTISDLDGDGIPDAFDRCMADPEDMDGFEDSDGCPEQGEAPKPGIVDANTNQNAQSADPTTVQRKMRRATDKPLELHTVSAAISPYRHKAWGAVIDQDERAWLVYGFGKSWVGTHTSRGAQLRGDAYRATFSPDGKVVGIVGDNGFTIADAASGKVLKRFAFGKGAQGSPENKLLRFRADGSVVYYDGCRLFRSTTAKNSASEPSSASLCGRPLAGRDGMTWFVYQARDGNVDVRKLDLDGDAPSLVLGGTSDEDGLSQILLSPSGRHLCYSRHKDGSELTCRDTRRGEDLMIWQGPTDTRAAFTSNGKLAFGAGALRSERDIILADLDALELRNLGQLGAKEKWLDPVGKTGFAASGGQQLLIFDVQRGRRTAIQLDAGEWEGFAEIPGRDHEYIVGKERKGTRDLFRVRVR